MILTDCSAINRTTGGRNGLALLLGAGLISGLQMLSGPAVAGPGDAASAAMVNAEGEPVGTVELTQRENGTSVIAKLENLPEGAHAFHIHETGECEPPFKSAGGHYNPTMANHGFDSQAGPHVGDLPNIYVPASGELSFEMFNTRLEVSDTLLDNDGAAVVIHEGPDDYETDPAGAAGDRIACGVLKGPAG
jgi:superoxide dismutase, Cu-Zn family